jgi:hypothetical protein
VQTRKAHRAVHAEGGLVDAEGVCCSQRLMYALRGAA